MQGGCDGVLKLSIVSSKVDSWHIIVLAVYFGINELEQRRKERKT